MVYPVPKFDQSTYCWVVGLNMTWGRPPVTSDTTPLNFLYRMPSQTQLLCARPYIETLSLTNSQDQQKNSREEALRDLCCWCNLDRMRNIDFLVVLLAVLQHC